MEEKIKKRFEKVENDVKEIKKSVEDINKNIPKKIYGRTIKCYHCSYLWKTKSEMLILSCPKCGQKVNTRKEIDSNIIGLAKIGRRKKNNIDKIYKKGKSIYDLDLNN